jgi:hypothetical protein
MSERTILTMKGATNLFLPHPDLLGLYAGAFLSYYVHFFCRFFTTLSECFLSRLGLVYPLLTTCSDHVRH